MALFSPFERMMAFRYLRARRQEGFVSVIAVFSFLGIMLGVATLIIVMSVMNGFRIELLDRIIGINGHLNVYGGATGLKDYTDLAARIRKLKGVQSVNPMIEGQVLASANTNASGAIVRGIQREDFLKRRILKDSITAGSLKDFDGIDVVVLGYRLARKLGLRVGDRVAFLSPRGKATPLGIPAPRKKTFTIIGIFNVGMSQHDEAFAYIPLEAAQIFFLYPKSAQSLEIVLDDERELKAIQAQIDPLIRGVGTIIDWQKANQSLANALAVERNVMFLILTLIIVVAAFNIISSLIMMVKDKGRDIAILRTMGASKGSVMRVFFLTGASIGVAGTVIGLGLGVLIAANLETVRQFVRSNFGFDLFPADVYFLARIPSVIDWAEVGQVVMISLVLSFFATLYPSWRAAKLDPVEALRYE